MDLKVTERGTWQPLLLLFVSCGLLWGISRAKSFAKYALVLVTLTVLVLDLVGFGATIYRLGLSSPIYYQGAPATAALIRQQSNGMMPFRTIAFRAQGNVMDKELGKTLLGANYTMAYGVESVIGLDGLYAARGTFCYERCDIPPWGYVDPEAVTQPLFRSLLDLWGSPIPADRDKGRPDPQPILRAIRFGRGCRCLRESGRAPRARFHSY